MSAQPAARTAPRGWRPVRGLVRAAFVGPPAWVENCSPVRMSGRWQAREIAVLPELGTESWLAAARRFRPHVIVVFDPLSLHVEAVGELPGLTLGVLVEQPSDVEANRALREFDRVVSFRPELTGDEINGCRIWRAIPPPISDRMFAEVRRLHARPRAMTVGRSTPHREAMLMPAKHHHDLLQLIHGIAGADLARLMDDYQVGVYVAPVIGGGFGLQVGLHLAAGHLLLTEALRPGHGLERNIDYLQFDSPDELVELLDRLDRFPEMHDRIRIRGRLKAEQYRSSRLFPRLLHDLLADVESFGTPRAPV